MSESCRDLVAFVDGELEPERAEAFRSHLGSCEACRKGLVEAMQLSVRLGALTPRPEQVEPAFAPRPEPPPVYPLVPAPRAGDRARRWGRRFSHWTTAALAAAALAAAVLVAVFWPRTPPATTNAFAGLTTRPFDIRFAHRDAARYRPRNEMRGTGGPPRDLISRATLAELEQRDKHALAIAAAWNGESLSNAAEQLRALAQTPSVKSDRAAIAMLTTDNENIESVLAELESLRTSSDDPVAARAARWNYAILLSRLDLPLSAAQAFHAIAGEQEAGWADEARDLAGREDRRGQGARENWKRASEAGEALATTGTPVPSELIQAVPGVLRTYFYNAVRTAPSPERVLALAPLAAELDQRGDRRILGDYVQRVAKLDFHRRAPLADAYAHLLQGKPIPAKVKAELTTPTASSDVIDIVMGAMVELEVVADHLDGFRRMAKQTGDPWFEIVLAQNEAAADVQRNDWLGAEARLKTAQKLCDPAITYQCLVLAHQLGELYEKLHRVPEAIEVLGPALRLARSAGEWIKARQLLHRLADVERFHSSTATARAYAHEVLLMADECGYQSAAYRILTGAALLDVDGPAARRYFEAALSCSKPDLLFAANYLADIGRLDPHPDDLTRLQGWLSTLRASGDLTAAQRALADEIEGRLLIERDRTAGTTLLQRAIAAAEALPRDVDAEKARAGAYSMLVFDAARQGEHARVLALIARDLGLPSPGACSVGIFAEDERSVVVVRGADGQDRAAYEPRRPPRPDPPAVSAELARGLSGCAHVQVMAQAALQGRPRVLPATLPWSYATGARRGDSPQGQAPAGRQALVVTDVTPPPDLHLPALSARAPEPTPSTRMLAGPTATPAQVLAAMRDAGEIQFHTHALVDMGISDASYLVLSPEPDGRHALTAEAIRGAELRGRPIVVLAACHSAQGARYQHAPWSLPHAFLSVGARAVFAAGTAIPDLDAGPFFTRVLERVRAGADPAVALRDERMAALASNPSSWAADVILFE